MADDLASTIDRLRQLHREGLLDDDELAEKLGRLRARHGPAAVDAALATDGLESSQPNATAQHRQEIGGRANVGAAVAGHVYGHIFINGYRERSHEELLAAYLGRVAERCSTMPLQGVVGERDTEDTLSLGLDQIYIQLATTAQAERERISGRRDLRAFDVGAYLNRHAGSDALPAASRTRVRVERQGKTAGGEAQRLTALDPDLPGGNAREWLGGEGSLSNLTADSLKAVAQDDQTLALQFFGPQLVTEAIAANRCLVLLGEPGSGKSTVLRYLARGLARAGFEEGYDPASEIEGWGNLGRLLPIFVPLLPLARQLLQTPERQGSDSDLWNYLVDQLQPRGAYQGLAAAVMDEIEAGNVILLLDGLDEVAGPESRRQVVSTVQSFAEQYKKCRVVVSCRTRAYDSQIHPDNERWQLRGWPVATLADLTPAQMRQFVGAWYDAVAAQDPVIAAQRDERVNELREALAARRDLRDLGVRSLLLTIMALVHLRQRNLPEDRASLYRECVEILLARWELRGKEETEYKSLMHYIGLPGVEVKALRPLLARAALRAHEARTPQNPGLLSADTLQVMVQAFLHDKGHPNPYEGARRFLEYTDYRAGLLQAAGAGSDYQFAHMTFQEYLAGLALVGDERPVQALLARRHEDRWRVPIFLGVGHAVSEGLPSLFRELLEELTGDANSAEGQRDLILAAELAEDVRWERLPGAGFARVRRELARDLARVVEGRELPASERVKAGALLGNLGDPRPGVCDLRLQMVEFAGGEFQIGITEAEHEVIIEQEKANNLANQARDWYGASLNTATTQVRPFWLARFPVTNAQYQEFIKAGGYEADKEWWSVAGRGWLRQTRRAAPAFWEDSRFGKTRLNHPVSGVTWHEAMAFCTWLTGRLADGYIYCLPSEVEWEYAARGAGRRVYPWGNDQLNGERANYDGDHGGTSAVGCFPAGATPEGLLDLAGNVWEWTRSEYKSYPYDPDDGREGGTELVKEPFTLRGGSWGYDPINFRAAYRSYGTPDFHYRFIGFRLARHLSV